MKYKAYTQMNRLICLQ